MAKNKVVFVTDAESEDVALYVNGNRVGGGFDSYHFEAFEEQFSEVVDALGASFTKKVRPVQDCDDFEFPEDLSDIDNLEDESC